MRGVPYSPHKLSAESATLHINDEGSFKKGDSQSPYNINDMRNQRLSVSTMQSQQLPILLMAGSLFFYFEYLREFEAEIIKALTFFSRDLCRIDLYKKIEKSVSLPFSFNVSLQTGGHYR